MDTKYSGYSLNQLHALFSTEQWNSLSFSDRLSACQEVENRYAAENNVEPCTVTFQPMEGRCYGWQNGDRITLNSHLLSDGQFVTHFEDENGVQHEARVGVLAPGWNTLDTVYHEGTHGIQEKTGNMPDTYINPDMDQDLYRIQGIEKQAYAQGQLRTLEAMQTYEKESGKLDPDHDDYLASVRNDSFQSALADAAKHYNDPNIEKTVNDVIHDRDAGIVRENPSASYKAVNDLCDSYGIGASRSSYQASENNNAAQNTNEAQHNNEAQNTPNNESLQNSNENNAGAKESSDEKSSGEIMDDGLNSSSSSKESSEDNSAGMNGTSVSLSGSMDDGAGNALSSGLAGSTMDDGLGNDPGFSAAAPEMDDGLGESGAQEEGGAQEADDGLGNDGNDNDGADSSSGGMDND